MSLPPGFSPYLPTLPVPPGQSPHAPVGALPPSAPWQAPSPRPRLSRSHWLLIALTVCLMAAVLVMAIVLIRHLGRRTRPAVLAPSAPEAVAPAGAAAPTPPPDAGDRPVAPAPRPAPAGTDDAQPLWKALGGLTRAHLYQNYLSIGLLADGVEEDLYPIEDAKSYLSTLTQFMDEVELEMSRLPDSGLRPEERLLLGKVREVLVLLRAQTRELRAYWDRGEKPSADRFHKAREESGAKLRELLRVRP
jgi:hypothetical protein